MKSYLVAFFLENWPRKLIALVLAIIIWLTVNYSMNTVKVVSNIPVRVVNLPTDKTIEGMQVNGILKKRVSLTLTGKKAALDELLSQDLEVVIDAKDQAHEWIATIGQKNLISLNPNFDPATMISRVIPTEMIIRQSKLVTEEIPILVTDPIGEAPKGYQFLDVWPYQLSMTINGPEETVKRIKQKGLTLTFNLADITQDQLDALFASHVSRTTDEISFFVPDTWKKISIPALSDTPIQISDAQSIALRINFSRQDLLPIGFSIPITIFFPPKYSHTINPETYSLATNSFITQKNGIKLFSEPLYAQGVSRLFLETVKDMIQVAIIAAPKSEGDTLLWNAQFMYPHELEDRYVAKVMAEMDDEAPDVQPHFLEDYLRNRFRSYMNRFRLYTPNHNKLSLKIELQANSISVTPQNYP